jgi:Adenylyl/Guanylyl and SMODS C-terminal sensor domain
VIPAGIRHLPYMERPTWRVARQAPIPVTVRASLYTGRNGTFVRQVQVTDYQPLPKRYWLKFDAVGSMGAVWPHDYEIKWRITNTDREAIRASALRGAFYSSDDKSSRWEKLEYRGLHLAEAFVVRKRDRTLVGSSAPFYVVIE